MVMVAVLVVVLAVVVVVAAVAVVVVMVVFVLVLPGVGGVGGPGLADQLGDQVALAVHDRDDLLAGQAGPVGRDDGGGGVFLLQQLDRGGDLGLRRVAGAAQNQAGSMADLVVVKFAEVLHIQLDLVDVGHRDKAVELDRQRRGHALDGAGHVGQLADAGRLDEDAVGVVGLDDLLERFAEVAHQAAADAAGVELVDLDAGFAHEAAVDADLAEFVLDQHELFAAERLMNELFDQRGLARAEETRKNVDLCCFFCHDVHPCICINRCVSVAAAAVFGAVSRPGCYLIL